MVHAPPLVDTLNGVVLYGLNGIGIGWTDACMLLACAMARDPVAIYTFDRRMARAAHGLGLLVLSPGG